MIIDIVNLNKTEPIPVSTNDKSCHVLLETVVQEMNNGRPKAEISAELVRQNWTRDAANRFCELALKIRQEFQSLPEQCIARARRGYDSMQGAGGWIGFGACAGIMLYLMGDNTRTYAKFALLPVLFGVVELISGALLWWPNRDYLPQEMDERGKKINKG
jgi:hypothetical protein